MHKRSALAFLTLGALVTSLSACKLPSLVVSQPTKVKPQEGGVQQTLKAPDSPSVPSWGSFPFNGRYSQDASGAALRRKYSTQALQDGNLILAPGESWTADIPAMPNLDVSAARIDYPIVAGACAALHVKVNDAVLSDAIPLTNKAMSFTLADGRTIKYYAPDIQAWYLFYSPDFTLNNRPESGGYQVVSDPGQAYRYSWNVSPLLRGSTSHLVIRNTNHCVGQPIVVRFEYLQASAPNFFSPNGDGRFDAATVSVRAVTSHPWKLSVVGKGVISTGTGDREVVWDGRVNGEVVPDGAYVLRVEDASATPTAMPGDVVVGVDTTPPDLSRIVSGIHPNDPRIVTLTGQISDAGAGVDFGSFKTTVSDGYVKYSDGGSRDPATGQIYWQVRALTPEEYAEITRPTPPPIPAPTPTPYQEPTPPPDPIGWEGFGGFYRVASLAVPREKAVHLVIADKVGNVAGEASSARLALSNTPAFSPNDDDSLDTAQITVKAAGAWRLSVVGKGEIAAGTGDMAVTWDGKVGGMLLPDERYTLHLEATDGSASPAESPIIVDTTPPVVQEQGCELINPLTHTYRYHAIVKDDLSGVDWQNTNVTVGSSTVVKNPEFSYDPSTGMVTYTAQLFAGQDEWLAYAGSSPGAAAYRTRAAYTVTPSDDDVMIKLFGIAVERLDRALNVPPTIVLRLDPDEVVPLGDSASLNPDLPPFKASHTKVYVSAKTRKGKYVAVPVTLTTKALPYSGYHNHDVPESPLREGHPTGVFVTGGSESDTLTLTTGQGESAIDYRCSGFAGLETITGSSNSGSSQDAIAEQVALTVRYPHLHEYAPDDRYVELKGWKPVHKKNHWCLDFTERALNTIAQEFYQRYGKKMEVNDISLPWGGPFDLGPREGVPFWSIGQKHIGHREGRHADIIGPAMTPTVEDDDAFILFIKRETGRWPHKEGNHIHMYTAR